MKVFLIKQIERSLDKTGISQIQQFDHEEEKLDELQKTVVFIICLHTAGVTCQQGRFSPPRHMIPPLGPSLPYF